MSRAAARARPNPVWLLVVVLMAGLAVAGPVLMVRDQLADGEATPSAAEGAQPAEGAQAAAGDRRVPGRGRAERVRPPPPSRDLAVLVEVPSAASVLGGWSTTAAKQRRHAPLAGDLGRRSVIGPYLPAWHGGEGPFGPHVVAWQRWVGCSGLVGHLHGESRGCSGPIHSPGTAAPPEFAAARAAPVTGIVGVL